jgi:nitrite reductase/ring-hydroxylating ferredoxin subunit
MKVVCPLAQVPPGCIREAEHEDGTPLAVYNVDGQVFATHAFCPHEGGPLADGALEGFVVTCPFHQWKFDVRTGIGDYAGGILDTFEVVVEDGEVKVGRRKPISIPIRRKTP